ncbi:MAG: transcription elongation factor GreA [Candidatus Andersenbacteria bacterium RIFCSPHIGHO2_12_FULL_45_11b]|uniref:Transcription elongation factor GreA n=1 Tax=Candidatus Andersenbacteria bacterium RIFCSPHIGHO2_12_FULL_45_11b TaxID=1797282 RepID=A0A1G1X9E5_9BACT|nr:MAG: transcription elongation factor GreA [Candidatus Andersenbacteria bacterium RIFCSPHIGHO2_12_FULL_45_11b]
MKDQFLTKEGMNELQERLHIMKTVRRREIAEAIHTAKEQGDLSENAEYQSAKEEQSRMEQEIADLEMTVKNARVVAKPKTDDVGIGNIVLLSWNGAEKEYKLVGSNEANPMEGKISNESPMGEALMGAKVGETIHIPTPAGTKECVIKKIS